MIKETGPVLDLKVLSFFVKRRNWSIKKFTLLLVINSRKIYNKTLSVKF